MIYLKYYMTKGFTTIVIVAFMKTFGAHCMKNYISAMLLIIGFSVINVSCTSLFPMAGNGDLVDSERTVSPFEKINISGTAEVHFYSSQEYRIVVTVDSNLLKYTEIITRGNILNIGTKKGNYLFTKYLVDVYCPVITGVSVSGSGRFKGTVECETFSAGISGSGDITITGNSHNSNIEISGSGTFNGDGFIINNATVNISGSGNGNINVLENLNVNISGSGEINYLGNPKIDSRISGSGRLKKL
jgi:hypothetical protein